MKIAMPADSHYPIRDGVVDAIDILRGELKRRGHEVLLIAPDPGEKDRLGDVHYIPAKNSKMFGGYFLPIFPSDSIFMMKDENLDVINVHGFAFMAARGVMSGKLLGKPVILTFHTPIWTFMGEFSPVCPEFATNVGWAYFRRLFKRADVTVAQTPSIAKELRDNGVEADIRVIPTGIDTERFRPGTDGSMIRERHGIKDRKVVIHVGRLSPEKCLDPLIRSFANVEDAVLLIVGKGVLENELKELTASLGLRERVIFTGFVPDEELPLYYAAADAAVSASPYEAQCLAIMNAMACGLPVACPVARAFNDFINDGENGILYDASAEGGCSDAIRKSLSADPSMGLNARRTAEEYAISKSVDAYLKLYEEVIERKRKKMF
jgi:1,2-diacylglycerol 3-alpha-glucosyltransferase